MARQQCKPLPPIGANVVALFWRKAIRNDDPDSCSDSCWDWNGTLIGKGYAAMGVRLTPKQSRTIVASRLSYFLATGKDPYPLLVCHTCDNPRCVRPSHLFLGSNGDNMRDASMKGRTSHGEKHPHSKLTQNDVRWIRHLVNQRGWQQSEAATLFKVCEHRINEICHLRSWRHVAYEGPAYSKNTARGSRIGNSRLTEEQVASIRIKASAGMTPAALARIYNVGQTTVYNVVARKTWAHIP